MLQRVVFKGVRDGVVVIVDASAPLADLMSALEQQTRLGRDFFAGSVGLLEFRDGELGEPAIAAVTAFLTGEMGFSEVRMNTTPLPRGSAATQVAAAEAEQTDQRNDDVRGLSAPSADATMFVKRTLRSGQKVSYAGHVVIMGHVNPGAEVVAGGDIIVLGSLRGIAHAGATGTETSSVFALKLQPTQLRIANFIARPPDGDSRVPTAPEVASVKDGALVIETYSVGAKA